MRTLNPYVKKLHEAALQPVVNDLVHEKEEGWKSRTARDSYTAKLQCLELMGIKIMRDALYKRVERQSKRLQNGTGTPEPILEVAPIEEVATYFNDHDESSISSNKSDTNESSNGTMVSWPKDSNKINFQTSKQNQRLHEKFEFRANHYKNEAIMSGWQCFQTYAK